MSYEKYRPWKTIEEVPIGALIEGVTIVKAEAEHEEVYVYFGDKCRSSKFLLKNKYQFQLDGQQDWCGVDQSEVIHPQDLKQKGGAWLTEAREWIKATFVNGSSVMWGSEDVLNNYPKVNQIEDLAARVSAKAINEYLNENNITITRS